MSNALTDSGAKDEYAPSTLVNAQHSISGGVQQHAMTDSRVNPRPRTA